MISTRRLLPLLVALLIWGHLETASASKSNAAPSASKASAPFSVMIDEAGARKRVENQRGRDPPGSPVNLFTPDEFQFYTLNGDGQLVMKQMTKQEIQGMIAAGGSGLPVDLGHHLTQLPNGEPEVSEVVQNVQKVLKGELNRPVPVHTASSSIPGSINSQWTNMLPYILSGGSVDQQDVVQDTNVILPALESEQPYVDVIPLQNGKPAESQSDPGPYYVPMSTTEEQQDHKFMTLKPAVTSTDKPIYLLGNMALDSGILGEQGTYSTSTKKRPTRPTTNAMYQKFTTTRPSLDDLNDNLNNIVFNVKNNSDGKPTLYIPLSVSPSLIADAQIQNKYDHLGDIGVDKIFDHTIKFQEKNTTKSPNPGLSTFGITLNKAPINVYPDDSGYTRVPMIQVPVISADKISTSTQRTSQQQTPMFEILPTISPGSLTSTTTKEGHHPLKVNVGPIGGFKKPDTTQKTTVTYHPVYNPTSKISTSSTTKASTVSTTPATYRPIYQPVNKPSTTKLTSSTYRPVFETITKTNTAPDVSLSSRPVHESTTKITFTSTYRPVYKPDTKLTTTSTKPTNANSPVFVESSTSSSEEMKVTWYPANFYTTGKASSPVLEFVTKPSTQSEGFKVTKHPNDVTETYTTKKVSSSLSEIVTKPAIQIDDSKVTKYPISAQETSIKNEVLVNVIEQLNDKKNPVITSQNTDKYVETTVPISESYDKEKTTLNVNYKLPDTTTLENLYTTDHDDYNIYSTTVFNDKEESKVSMTTMDQEAKTEGYTIYEDPTMRPLQVDESSTKIITDVDSPSTQQFKMEESTTFRITTSSIAEDTIRYKTEKYNNTQLNENDLIEQSSTLGDDIPKTTEPWIENETTIRFVPIKEDTTKYSDTLIPITDIKSTSNKEDSTIVPPKNTESITEYSTSIIMTVDPSEKEDFLKKPLNDSEQIIIISNTLAHQENDKTKIKVSTISDEKIKTETTTKIFEETPVEIITKQSDNLPINATTFAENNKFITNVTNVSITQNYSTSLKPLNGNSESTTESNTPIYMSTGDEMEDKITTFSYDTSVTLNHFKNPSTMSAITPPSITTENKKQSDVIKNNVTPVYEKMETISESVSLFDENTKLYDKNKYSFKEEELSTVKVIPVYDDDGSIYNLPAENPSQFTLYTENLTNGQKPVLQVTTTMQSVLATKINPTESALPGLQETFNNYMKEHYETKLSTIYNDDISMLTTFPPSITEEMSTNKIKLSSSTPSSVSSNEGTTKYQTNPQVDDELITSTSINENNTPLNENIGDSFSTTKQPALNYKNKTETPIIYLDLTSSSDDKENSAPLNSDNKNNSSMTIIKIKNPVSEVEKVIEDAPRPTNTPSTVLYTLPAESKEPNSIASGLIAGYPTYSQVKPVTESVFTSTTSEMVPKTKKPNLNVATKTEESLDETTVTNVYTSTYGKPTITPTEDEDLNASTTTTMVDVRHTETAMPNYPTLKTSNYDLHTEIPIELSPTDSHTKIPSQPEENDEFNTSFNPPLEKISDLINQLQNSPSNRDSMIGYDYSNGIATTIVPYDKFETIITEHVPTTTDDTLTTIFENLSKTSLEAQNTTYVVLQTLPVNHSPKPIEISTEHTTRRITTKEPTTIAMTTQNSSDNLNTTAGTTTVISIVQQPTTGKPYITSTYSTTKGSLEKIQSTIDKSAGRINLEEEKTKVQMKPTEASKFTMKNKNHYSTSRRPVEGYQSYSRKPTRPISKGTTATTTKVTTVKSTTIAQYTTSKPTEDSKEANKWTLIPQKGTTDKASEVKVKESVQQLNPQIVPLDHSTGAIGLDQSNKALDKDVAEFLSMCNELSFKFWMLANSDLNPTRSVTMSPFGMISTLAMIFLGARGLTSNQMNDILKLDDVVTFNPHLVFQNITDTVTLSRGQGIENAAFVRALFADRLKVRRIIPFYKEQTQQFYEGAVVDINFSTAGDILRRKTNLLIRKQTGGRIKDFLKQHTVSLKSPLTALSANVFQTSCEPSDASSDGRDGEMYFAVSQTVKQRKLVPIPAVVWKSGVSAGYEPSLDATAVALADPKRPVSMIMVMPGQQGVTAPGDNLERLEYRLFGNPEDNAVEKLLKVIIPRRVEVQMPKFSHRSIVNVTSALKKMGFDQLFTKTADFKGINGAGHDLYLAEMMQMNLFCTCGDDSKLGTRHLSETYPGTSPRHSRSWELNNDNIKSGIDNLENNEQDSTENSDNCEEDDTEDGPSLENPREDVDTVDRINNSRQKIRKKWLRWLTPAGRSRCRNRRQAEVEKPKMKMDKPFLYLIRHNLSGLILHIGRFNPKNQS